MDSNVTVQETKSFKQILLLGVMMFTSTFSGAIQAANKPEFVYERFPGVSPFLFSLFDVVAYLSYFIGIVIGIMSDWKGERKRFITTGSAGSMVFLYLMTVAGSYPLLLVARFVEGIFSIMIWQTIMVLNLDHSKDTNRAKHMGVMGVSLGTAMAVGSMAGGFIAELGTFVPYYLGIVLRGILLVLNVALVRHAGKFTTRPPVKESLLLLGKKPGLVVPGIFNLVDRLHMGFIVLVYPLFIVEVFGLGTGFRGMVLGVASMPALFLMYPVGKKSDTTWGRFKPLVGGSLGYGTSLILIGLLGIRSVPVFLVLIVIQGVFSGFTTSPASALVGDLVSKENNAMATGLFNFMGNVGIVIGPLIGGVVIEQFGYVLAFVIAGLIELVSLVANVLVARRLRFLDL